MKVLVLGNLGMLGHMVVKYLRAEDVNVTVTNNRWPNSQTDIINFEGDYIINCIGAIPQRTKDFDINWQIPIWLDLHAPCRVIHPGTDCEMDNDAYGTSKNIVGNYIRNICKQSKSIKTSVIGPELNSNVSLLEWFLAQEGEVIGYSEAMWNGNTTLEWSKQCLRIMQHWDRYKAETVICSEGLSKYELLLTMKEVYNKNIKIIAKSLGEDKCLKDPNAMYSGNIKKQLIDLKEFYIK
jgi:dTDP-4-dehydrorhamnose reductase